MLFSEVIGQDVIKKSLRQVVLDGKVPHSMLFLGKEGVGKLSLALALAQYLNCENKSSEDSCGVCHSCVKFAKLSHPDLHFVFPIVKTASSSVCDDFLPQWRNIILEKKYFSYSQWLQELEAENKQALIYSDESEEIIKKLNLKTYESPYKIMIIWQADKMHVSCPNKILKILEEPPKNTVFILITENPDSLLSTILSRTQRISIPPIELHVLEKELKEKHFVSEEEVVDIARIANGNYVAALDFINKNEQNSQNLQLFMEIMRLAYMRKVKEIKTWADQVATLGRERQKSFLQYAQHMIRENFIYNFQQQELVYMIQEERDFALNFAKFIHEDNIFSIMDELETAERYVESNVNAKMIFFDFGLQLIVLLKK